jgi:hypothetical protein
MSTPQEKLLQHFSLVTPLLDEEFGDRQLRAVG